MIDLKREQLRSLLKQRVPINEAAFAMGISLEEAQLLLEEKLDSETFDQKEERLRLRALDILEGLLDTSDDETVKSKVAMFLAATGKKPRQTININSSDLEERLARARGLVLDN